MAKRKATAKTVPKQLTPWQPGQSGNPAGRPPGARNKLGEDFIKAMLDDFAVNGSTAIVAVRTDDPAAYLNVIAKIIPKAIDLDAKVSFSDAFETFLRGLTAQVA